MPLYEECQLLVRCVCDTKSLPVIASAHSSPTELPSVCRDRGGRTEDGSSLPARQQRRPYPVPGRSAVLGTVLVCRHRPEGN